MKDFTEKIVALIERSKQIMPRLSIVVIEAVKSDVAREFHREGMYTLDDVDTLLHDHYSDYLDYLLNSGHCSRKGEPKYFSFKKWFEEIKSK